MNKNLLLISEFLPVHKGHEKALDTYISHNISQILFCIDGAYRKLSDETPFSTQEREDMIAMLMEKHQLPYSIMHLRDTDNAKDRVASLHKLLSPLSGTTILSDTKEICEITESLGYNTKNIAHEDYIPGILRNQIASKHNQILDKKIPHSILDYITKIDGFTRSRNFKNSLFHGPGITVDIIARNKKGEIAIIDRAREPYGKALIGGFIEIGDSGIQTSYKETKEESNLHGIVTALPQQKIFEDSLQSLLQTNNINYLYEHQPFYVMTDPNRDKRGHIITLAYIIDVANEHEMEALDDAKNGIQFMDPHIAINHPDIFQNHKTIIAAYLAQL